MNDCGRALRPKFGFPDAKCPADSPLAALDAKPAKDAAQAPDEDDARKAAGGQLVLRPPEEVDRVVLPVDDLQPGRLLPQRREHDVRLGEEPREPGAIDPPRGLRHRFDHAV